MDNACILNPHAMVRPTQADSGGCAEPSCEKTVKGGLNDRIIHVLPPPIYTPTVAVADGISQHCRRPPCASPVDLWRTGSACAVPRASRPRCVALLVVDSMLETRARPHRPGWLGLFPFTGI